ncbi:FtsX-like permease family protein [Enterococcus sp. AZ103]|uniref:FtsX-like permease family protein n=1 Tax=Enterococcus sp. AZ103 TaxID=2774628 RepID=UPI003F278772
MKSALGKSNLREIWQTKTRFLSILGIIFLGVAFFVGLSATGPDMLETANQYYKKSQLADATVLSSTGLTKTDVALTKKNKNIAAVEGRYFQDFSVEKENQVLRLYSYQKQDKINQLTLLEGKLPIKDNQIVLDEVAKNRHGYRIGDQVTINQTNQQMTRNKFKVVGFVKSAQYIENISRGNTNVGKGSVDYFGYTKEKNFNQSVYTELLVRFKNLENVSAYSKTYDDRLEKNLKKLKKDFKVESDKRITAVKEARQNQLDKMKEQIASPNDQGQMDQAQASLSAGQSEYQQKTAEGTAQITERETLLAQIQAQITAKEQELQTVETLNQQKDEARQTVSTVNDQLNQVTQQLSELNREKLLLTESNSIINQALQGDNSHLNQLNQLAEALSNNQKEAIINTLKEPSQGNLQSLLNSQNERLSEINQQTVQLNPQQSALSDQLSQAQAIIDQKGMSTLQQEQTRKEIEQLKESLVTGTQQLEKGKADLAESQQTAEAELNDAQKSFSGSQQTMAEITAQIIEEETAITNLDTIDYVYQDRNDNPGYSEYQDNANRISSLATVFPIIFFLIAALVSLTTMTRMVEEKRSELGTLKALGFRNREIAQKYILYASLASGIGTVLGLAVGFYFLPTIIFNAYGQLYNLTNMVTPWYLSYGLIALIVALLCSVGSTLFVLRYDLKSTPASLMQPKAPKSGKRILLERITPIWSRLSFIQKVTLRNLFRYKQRMLMTVIGIAGCMSMVVTGFGLRDSIGDIVNIQFDKLWHYQAMVTFDDDISDNQLTDYLKELESDKNYENHLLLDSETYTVSKSGVNTQDVNLRVPKEVKRVDDFIEFNDRTTDTQYQLNNQGAIINEKLAKLFDLKVGNKLTVKNTDGKEFKVKIANITENYVGHFIYLTPTYYQKIFDEKPKYNTDLVNFKKDVSHKKEDSFGQKLMGKNGVVNVTFTSRSQNALRDTVNSLNIIMWVLIVSAGLLAFIVLYNLTNINISERIRELSTIKVLGFYDMEVVAYVYRENILLTLMGILFGLLLGKIEHHYILQTVEVDITMFSPIIQPLSYLYASGITLLFAIIVGVIMYFKLKKIDMIEALKASD